MICSDDADDDGDAPDRRGAYGFELGVAMLAVLAGQPSASPLPLSRPLSMSGWVVFSYQRR